MARLQNSEYGAANSDGDDDDNDDVKLLLPKRKWLRYPFYMARF